MADALFGGAGLARAIGTHALACYAGGLFVVVAATVVVWTLRARIDDRHRLRAGNASFAAEHLRFVLVVILLAAALFLAMTDGLGDAWTMGTFDTTLAATLSRSLSPATLQVFSTVTHLADANALIVLATIVALALLVRREPRLALGWALGCAGNGLLNPALKRVFERVRPTHDAAYVTTSVYSFPSGHTSGAVVVYGLLAYLAIRRAPQRWRVAIAAAGAALVFTVACSRVMLQVHWASDVLGGVASGSAWLAICVVALERFAGRAARDAAERRTIGWRAGVRPTGRGPDDRQRTHADSADVRDRRRGRRGP